MVQLWPKIGWDMLRPTLLESKLHQHSIHGLRRHLTSNVCSRSSGGPWHKRESFRISGERARRRRACTEETRGETGSAKRQNDQKKQLQTKTVWRPWFCKLLVATNKKHVHITKRTKVNYSHKRPNTRHACGAPVIDPDTPQQKPGKLVHRFLKKQKATNSASQSSEQHFSPFWPSSKNRGLEPQLLKKNTQSLCWDAQVPSGAPARSPVGGACVSPDQSGMSSAYLAKNLKRSCPFWAALVKGVTCRYFNTSVPGS